MSDGTVMSVDGPDGFTTPLVAVQPCTSSPVLVTSCPAELRLKLPSRVYIVSPAGSCTTKNPLPWIAASSGPLVV